MKVRIQGFAGVLLIVVMGSVSAAPPRSAQQYFVQLRSSGGVTPLAQLVCFPDPGQGQDATFTLVAFTKDLASTERSKGLPVDKDFIAAEAAPENLRGIFQWVFNHGVRVNKDPEILYAVPGSKGSMWSVSGKVDGKATELRVTFATSGRYSRVVLIDGNVEASVYGQCQPVDSAFAQPSAGRH